MKDCQLETGYGRFTDKGKDYLNVHVDYGNGDPKPEILQETDTHFLCRLRGRNNWLCLSETAYYHPKFLIFKKLNVFGKKKVKHIEEFEYTRQTKKEVYAKAKEFFENLKEAKKE